MSLVPLGEVFTIEEVARAAGVPLEAVRTLLGRGELTFIPGTRFISVNNAPRTARRLQEIALTLHAQKIARRGESHLQVSVPPISEKPVLTTAREEAPKPTPVEPVIQPAPQAAPEPVPAKVIVAPVETVAANDRDREGAIEHAVEGPDSHGPGSHGGVGSGQGTGNGEGLGSGIGDGEG